MYIRKHQHPRAVHFHLYLTVNTVSTEVLSFEKRKVLHEGGYSTISTRIISFPKSHSLKLSSFVRKRAFPFSFRTENLANLLITFNARFYVRCFPSSKLDIIDCPRTRTICRIHKVSIERRASVVRQNRSSTSARHMEDLWYGVAECG